MITRESLLRQHFRSNEHQENKNLQPLPDVPSKSVGVRDAPQLAGH